MILIRLFILISIASLFVGCATGSDLDAGGYFSTGTSLSSAEMNNNVNFRQEINHNVSVNGAILMGSNPANMREEYIGARKIH